MRGRLAVALAVEVVKGRGGIASRSRGTGRLGGRSGFDVGRVW